MEESPVYLLHTLQIFLQAHNLQITKILT